MSKNKIAKLLLVLGIGTATAFTGLAVSGCNPDEGGSGTGGGGGQVQQKDEYTVTFNLNGAPGTAPASAKVEQGEKVSEPAEPKWENHNFDGWFTAADGGEEWNFENSVSGNLTLYAHWTLNSQGGGDQGGGDEQKTEYTIKFEVGGGSAVQEQKVVKDGKATRPQPPTYGEYTFAGWFTDENFESEYDFDSPVTGNVTLYAKWTEMVSTSVDFVRAATELGSPSANVTVSGTYTYAGKITFPNGYRFEPTTTGNNSTGAATGCVNTQGKAEMVITLSGDTNSISVYGRGASSGKDSSLKLVSVAEDGTETDLEQSQGVGSGAYFAAPLKKDNLPAGTYKIYTDGSVRIFELVISEMLTLGTPESMELVPANVDFLLGREVTAAGLVAQVTYSNGSEKSQANLQADLSGVDNTKAGEYTVPVTYTENGVTLTQEYTVYVYAVTAVELATYTTNGNKQTTFQQVYKAGSTFSADGLTVVATAACGQKQLNFNLNSNEYEYTAPDLAAEGAKTFTVTAKTSVTGGEAISQSLTINVVGEATAEQNTLTLSVDASKDVSATNFKTITDALVYLKQLNLAEDVIKVINIADGEYNEKVFIDIPNVQLIGSDTNTPNHTTDNGVVIVFNAIAGAKEPSGGSYGTNGSATVTVAAGATGFVARNITFKNHYNTYELYQQSLGISSDSQAVALLVESPKAMFFGCKLTSYHDTLYSNKGNHYYEKCWIEGHTDYIFGQDAHAYFNDCDIFSIGAGAEEKNGGYVVALKPSASTYYFVFNNCRFDADENTKEGSVALGRAWGADMKMAVLNSVISAKFSTAAHTKGTGSGERYCTMSGNEPNPLNMLEYNNTGAGAIAASLDNTCTVMDAAASGAYGLDKLADIIGWNPSSTYYTVTLHYGEQTFTLSVQENGVLTEEQILAALGGTYAGYKLKGVYTDAQMQSAYDYEPVTSTVDLYLSLEEGDLVYDKDATIDFADYEGTLEGTTGKYKGVEIDATNGKVRANQNSVQVNPGTVFKIHVAENATVTVEFYQTYGGPDAVEISEAVEGVVTITVKADATTTYTSGVYIVAFKVAYPHSGITFSASDWEAQGWEVGDIQAKTGTNLKGLNCDLMDNEYFTLSTTDNYYLNAVGEKAGGKATAADGTEFTCGFVPTGNNKTLTLTAKQDITFTVYFTMTDSSWSDKKATLNWTVVGQGESGQSAETAKASVAYMQQITLKAGDVCTMTAASRLVLFAIVVD